MSALRSPKEVEERLEQDAEFNAMSAMEKGSASVSIGSYMQVLFVLGLDENT